MFDFSRITPPTHKKSPTDPIEIFGALKRGESGINDLWMGQADALRSWGENRDSSDIAIALNTGAGKTLVGLLIAQSLANETHGKVLYACNSRQLVAQTERLARSYGLEVTTYLNQEFSNNLYSRGEAPCITTYHALFTGNSRFMRDEVDAVVFDDAHTAGSVLRSYFSLSISSREMNDTYNAIASHFRRYFERVGLAASYEETISRMDTGVRFIPPFAIRENLGQLRQLLNEGNLAEQNSTKFSWVHLRDKIDLCAFFITRDEITITPPMVPIDHLPYFHSNVRRVYLSATLGAQDDFERTFGRQPKHYISPQTSAGENQRMIIFPSYFGDNTGRPEEVKSIQHAIAPHKSLVIVPTNASKDVWSDAASTFNGDFQTQLEAFRISTKPACLVAAARFDGIDLSGDSCRILIIDGLPTGMNAIERYQWEHLNLRKILRTTVAARLIQSLGRISRGLSDYGTVIICGAPLLEWLESHENQESLPKFIQHQLEMGRVFSEGASIGDLEQLIAMSINQDPGWVDWYENTLQNLNQDAETVSHSDAWALDVSKAESKFRRHYWNRDYERAAEALESIIDVTIDKSTPTAAWHLIWIGYCYDLVGQNEAAFERYIRSHRITRQIPPPIEIGSAPAGTEDQQVYGIAALLKSKSGTTLEIPPRFDTDLAFLDDLGSSTNQIERALENLGMYFGLDASRPDNEFSTGPDVLWIGPDDTALCLEAKTEKNQESVYTKADLGQMHDHRQWTSKHHDVAATYAFVGPEVSASPSANPDAETYVIDMDEFRSIRDDLRIALEDIVGSSSPITVHERVKTILLERDLAWSSVLSRMKMVKLINID